MSSQSFFLEALPVRIQKDYRETIDRRAGSFYRGSLHADIMQIADREVFELTAYVLASKVTEDKRTFTVHTPATWWQHAKESFPSRLKKIIWPSWSPPKWRAHSVVRYQASRIVVDFTRYDTFPRADVPFTPEFGVPHRYEMAEIQVDSARQVSQHGSGVSESRKCVPAAELAWHLSRTLIRLDTLSLLSVTDDFLKELEKMGVNTSELVTYQNLRYGSS